MFFLNVQNMPLRVNAAKKYNHLLFLVILFVLFVFGISSCKQKPAYHADISNTRIDPVEIQRYDKVLFGIDPENMVEELQPYLDEYYLFLGDEIHTPMGQQQLYDYITDPFIIEVFDDLNQVWDNVASLEQKLTLAFRYFKYHFPDRTIPDVYSYVSGIDFEHPVYYQDDVVVFGLDMFLGRDYHNYDRVGVPTFKRYRFTPEAAPVEIMRTIGRSIIHETAHRPETLLDFMILEGKLIYFLDAMFPDLPDSLKIYYSAEQIQWAQSNEGQAWSFFINNELLYSSDRQMIQKMTGDTPFTAPFSGSSAPRMGIYNGWQIVREYMRRNTDISLNDLIFNQTDARQILQESRYRP
jgi:hypothetical protein